MILAKVVGHATSTVKHPSLKGCRLLLCETMDADGAGSGAFLMAADYLGASLDSEVMIVGDGDAAVAHHGDKSSPLRNMVAGLVDSREDDRK